jgi:hypothetical protein
MVVIYYLFNVLIVLHKFDGCCSTKCKETIHTPLERQKELRKGIDNGIP